jgi:hypothetical protein
MLAELKFLLADEDKLIAALKHLNPRKPQNVTMKRIGSPYDGGYIMIDEYIINDAFAYSFGVGRNVSWETHMSKDYNSKIHMYDHTVNSHNSEDSNLIFHKVGLGSNNSEKLKTIKQIIKDNGHTDEKNMVLQCDIEGAEWDIFTNTPQEILTQFSQLIIEFHWLGPMLTDNETHPDGYEKIVNTLKALRKNFTPYHIHGNNHSRKFSVNDKTCANVIEVSYIRNDLVEFTDEDVVFPTKLDNPNNRNGRDIKLGNFKW